MAKRATISHLMAVIQVGLFIVVVGMLVVVGVYFQMQTRRETADSMQKELNTAVQRLDNRLTQDSTQVRELLHTIMNTSDLWSSQKDRQYFGKMTIKSEMNSKANFYEDMEMLFVGKANDYYIGNATQMPIKEKLAYQDYIETNMADMAAASKGSLWLIRDIQGKKYCFLVNTYADQNLYVGIGLPAEELFAEIVQYYSNQHGEAWITDAQGTGYGEGMAQEESGHSRLFIHDSLEDKGLFFSGYMAVSVLQSWRKSTLISIILLGILCLGSIAVQYQLLRRAVVKPVKNLADVVGNMAEEGGRIEDVQVKENASTIEIYTLQKTLNYLMKEVLSARILLYEKKIQEQDTELRYLRAQLRPHFYLNSLTTINSMTYQNRNEDIRKYLSSFAAYLRYMMQMHTSMVSLRDELEHIQNYIDMQEIKFPSSVVSMIECAKELEQEQIPHLILYTIVENSFKYAMNMEDTLVLLISCEIYQEEGFNGYHIVVEDNGKGYDDKTLDVYNKDSFLEDSDRSHIGLTNVKRSLFLQYHRNDLLRISNAKPHGARTEILIPAEEGEENGIDSIGS